MEGFKVIEVPKLARLAYAFATSEPLVTVETEAVVEIVVVATEQKNRADCSTCPALARIAMDYNYVLWVR